MNKHISKKFSRLTVFALFRKIFMSDSAALLEANSTWNRAWVVAGLQLRFPESDIRLFPRPIHPCRPEPSLRSHISRLFQTGLTQVLFDWPWAGNTATTTRASSHTVSEIKKARSPRRPGEACAGWSQFSCVFASPRTLQHIASSHELVSTTLRRYLGFLSRICDSSQEQTYC